MENCKIIFATEFVRIEKSLGDFLPGQFGIFCNESQTSSASIRSNEISIKWKAPLFRDSIFSSSEGSGWLSKPIYLSSVLSICSEKVSTSRIKNEFMLYRACNSFLEKYNNDFNQMEVVTFYRDTERVEYFTSVVFINEGQSEMFLNLFADYKKAITTQGVYYQVFNHGVQVC